MVKMLKNFKMPSISILSLITLGLVAILLVTLLLSFNEAGLYEGQSLYANKSISQPPPMNVRLGDLNLSDNSVGYSLLPIDTNKLADAIPTMNSQTIGRPSQRIEIVTDRDYTSTAETSDFGEETIYLPIDDGSRVSSASPIDIRNGYQTRLPVRHAMSFWYPYDWVEISVTTAVVTEDTAVSTGCSQWRGAALGAEMYFPAWRMITVSFDKREHYFRCHSGSVLQTEDPGNVFVRLGRPWFLLLLTPVLILCSALLIILFSRQRTETEVWTFLTAMAFGLWSIRSILITPDVIWPTLLDLLIVTLYIGAFGFSIKKISEIKQNPADNN